MILARVGRARNIRSVTARKLHRRLGRQLPILFITNSPNNFPAGNVCNRLTSSAEKVECTNVEASQESCTPLEGLPTSEIVLNNFKASLFGSYFDHFSLTEIQVAAAVTQFSAFNAGGEIEGNQFEIQGGFTLGAGTNGINPLTESVVLQLGTFSVTIPSGSFKRARGGSYQFEGTVDGAALEIHIVPASTNRYAFAAEASGANLTGAVSPVSVALTIGDDAGTTTVRARQ